MSKSSEFGLSNGGENNWEVAHPHRSKDVLAAAALSASIAAELEEIPKLPLTYAQRLTHPNGESTLHSHCHKELVVRQMVWGSETVEIELGSPDSEPTVVVASLKDGAVPAQVTQLGFDPQKVRNQAA